jgi:peptidoglycan hydrolase CwlO-like protein
MSALPSTTQSEFSTDSLPANSRVKRSLLALVRFLITLCIGVAATLAWQSYGDAARAMIANSYPQLGWLAPQTESVAQNAPDVIALAAPATPSPDQQQSNVKSPDLDAMQQSIEQMAANQEQITRGVDRIAASVAASQERITRSVDQLAVSQDWLTREITKLEEIEQSIRYRNSEPSPPSPRPASASAPKPVTRPASTSALAPKPAPRPPAAPTVP